jgi:hypothetical protein
MLLQKKEDGTIVEIVDIQELIGPTHGEIMVKIQEGQEEQEPESVQKQNLVFPSGESLPMCWLDADYRTKN